MEEVSMLQPHIRNTMEQIAKFIFVPSNEHEYNQLVALLDEVTDIVRDDETHPLVNMMDVLGVLIENYEAQTVSEPAPDPIAVLKHLMAEYNLKQQDLSELGSPRVVSEILNGTRALNLRQIQTLSHRFQVSPLVFIANVDSQAEGIEVTAPKRLVLDRVGGA